jgi:hypothetical protein
LIRLASALNPATAISNTAIISGPSMARLSFADCLARLVRQPAP